MSDGGTDIGLFRGHVEVLLRGIAAMGIADATIELDGNSEELERMDPAGAAHRPRRREWRLGSVRFFWRKGGYELPLDDRTMAQLLDLAGRSASPEIAIDLRVRDANGPLLEAHDVGDDTIWVSDRVPEAARERLRAALGPDLT